MACRHFLALIFSLFLSVTSDSFGASYVIELHDSDGVESVTGLSEMVVSDETQKDPVTKDDFQGTFVPHNV